jgi:hypothetical protein
MLQGTIGGNEAETSPEQANRVATLSQTRACYTSRARLPFKEVRRYAAR